MSCSDTCIIIKLGTAYVSINIYHIFVRKTSKTLSPSFSEMQRSLFSVVMLLCTGMPELTSPIVIFTSLLGGAGPGICRERPRSFGCTVFCNVYTQNHEGSYAAAVRAPRQTQESRVCGGPSHKALAQLHRCSTAQPGVRAIARKDPGSQDSKSQELQGLQGDPLCS